MRLEIKKMGINGEGIAYHNKKVVFVNNCVIGDIIEVVKSENEKGFIKVNEFKIIEPSEYRVQPPCRIFNKCQVCSIMPLKYDKQIDAKIEYLKDSLLKYSKLKISIDKIVKADNNLNYRNSIKLPFFNFKDKLAVGIHFRDSNNYVMLKNCVVQKQEINDAINELLSILDEYRYRAYDKKTKIGLRYLLVRSFSDEIMITFVTGKNTVINEEALEKIKNIKNVVSINTTTNTKNNNEMIVESVKNLVGKKSIDVPFNGFNFKLSPQSFMQLNTPQAIKLYDIVKEYLGNNNNLVLDLYCGVGSISCYVNECAKEIIGIELNPQAIKDAKENAKKHRLKHLKFVSGDVNLKIKTYAKDKNVDAIIVDPPRVGLSEYLIESIIKSKTKKLIYVSCNPSTLGKDINLLSKYYKVDKVSVVDMFSHTMHVETVVLMSRKDK